MKNLLNNCSSVHLFPSGKIIFKFPLGREKNITKKLPEEEIEALKSAIASWRIVEANGVIHAVKNPTGEVSTEIPSDLSLTGKTIVFGEVGSGKSTFLNTVGRKRVEDGDNVLQLNAKTPSKMQRALLMMNLQLKPLCRPISSCLTNQERKHYKQLKDLSSLLVRILRSLLPIYSKL